MDAASDTNFSFTRSSAFQCGNWELRESVLPVLRDVAVSETLFTVGNGFIGVRGFPEESETVRNASFFRNHEHSSGGNNISSNNNSGVGGMRRNKSSNGIGDSLRGGAVSPFGSGHQHNHTGSRYRRKGMDSVNNSQPASPVGISSSRTEFFGPPASVRGCYVAGFCEHRLLQNRTRAFTVGQCTKESFLVRTPNPFSIDVFVAGEHVSAATGKVTSHARRLDLRTGELKRKMVWESHAHSNVEVVIESTRFASAKRKNIAVVRFTVSAKNVQNTDIRILSRTETCEDPTTRRACGLENMTTRHNLQECVSVVQARTRNSCKHLTVATIDVCNSTIVQEGVRRHFSGASVVSFDSDRSPNESFDSSPVQNTSGAAPQSHPYAHGSSDASKSINAATSLAPKCYETEFGTETIFTSIISDNVVVELTKTIGFFSDDDAVQEDLGELAVQRTREAAQLGYDQLALENRQEMNRFWETADIRYKGSRSMQGAFRFNLLQLSMSGGLSPRYGYPTRGLTGESMGGVQQWDVDALVVPALSHTCPAKARSLLQFRVNSLYQAKNLATDLDLPRGAVYPLRTITGVENPAPSCGAFLFVNAVVALAMRHYVMATNDYSILAEGGAEVVLATALVWLEWGTWEKGQFHLRNVNGPDMYAGELDDNLFTNMMAQQHMQWMVQVAAYFRETWLIRWNEILEHSLATEEDIAELDRAAAKMVLPFDGVHRIHPVDCSFMHKKPWCFESLTSPSYPEPLIYRYHPTVLHRHRVCRIPDVLLAMMLLPDQFSHDEYRANFHFYSSITSKDSALRHAINGVVASQLRVMDKAMPNFTGALYVDVDNVLGDTGGGMHMTTAAGSWWVLAVGFGGMRVVKGTLHFNPTLPDGCEEYSFFARHRGCLIRVLVTQRMVTYTLEGNTNDVADLLLMHADNTRIHLRKGIPETVRLFRETRVFDFDSVIFEMDSLIDNVEEFHFDAWKETLESYFKETDFPEFTMTKEIYLAYLRHMKPATGLPELFKRFNRPPLMAGTAEDAETAHTTSGLLWRKLKCFRRLVKERELRFREGAFQLLTNLRQCGITVGCVTGSKNGRWVLNETPQLRFMFDDFLDRNDGDERNLRWRPELDFFEACAKNMDSAMNRTIIVLDGTDGFSKSCIEKFCLLIDVSTHPENISLEIPRITMNTFTELTMEVLDEHTARDGVVHHREATAYRRAASKVPVHSENPSLKASPVAGASGFPEPSSSGEGIPSMSINT